MASNRPIRGDISGDGSFGDPGVLLDWHRLFFSPAEEVSAAYPDSPMSASAILAADAFVGQVFPAQIAAPTAAAAGQSDGLEPAGGLGFETSLAPVEIEAFLSTVGGPLGDSYWRPSVLVGTTAFEGPTGITLPPEDPAQAAGLLSKAEAVIWSGPLEIVFPGDGQAQAGAASTEDLAPAPGALTRADLDPILSAMGSGASHDLPHDVSGAFLPPESSDPPLLADSGLLFAPPPIPPPPESI